MAAPIYKIGKDAFTATVKKAKVVTGNFGNQLWAAVVDTQGEEHTLYLPWANSAGDMSGVVQQFIRTGVIGPEDFNPAEGTYMDQLQDKTFTFVKIFKDGKQFINVSLVSVLDAAIKELDLQRDGDEQQFAKSLGVSAPSPQPTAPARKPRESADARIARAYAHVMETYAPQLAEMDPQLARAIVALTATFAIGYEKEG